MKKFFLALLLCLGLCAQRASAQALSVGATMSASATTTGTGISVTTSYYHQVTWTVVGTVSTCAFTIDSSPDNSSWTTAGVIASTTCTSGGVTSLVNVATTWARINLSTFTGTGKIFISYQAYGSVNQTAPGPIGSVTPSTGAFTTLTATSAPSLGAIGGTTPAVGTFTTLRPTTSYLGASSHLLNSITAPSIAASGCGTAAASIAANNGTAAFTVNIGTTNSGTCTITMPAATTGWACSATNLTHKSTTQAAVLQTSASNTTTVVLQNYTDIMGTGVMTDSDVLSVQCAAY